MALSVAGAQWLSQRCNSVAPLEAYTCSISHILGQLLTEADAERGVRLRCSTGMPGHTEPDLPADNEETASYFSTARRGIGCRVPLNAWQRNQ
jgi:hypothetical protein